MGESPLTVSASTMTVAQELADHGFSNVIPELVEDGEQIVVPFVPLGENHLLVIKRSCLDGCDHHLDDVAPWNVSVWAPVYNDAGEVADGFPVTGVCVPVTVEQSAVQVSFAVRKAVHTLTASILT